ncbi:MAG: zinc-binding protein [Desulfobulbaceae bacterium]|nr:MAG: zinc-binding protein [Desulfobulbaceae bacterium]
MTTMCTAITASDIILLPCSGPCNVGQLSHLAAVGLTGRGFGRMHSLAGIAAGVQPFLAAARAARQRVAIDGCLTACSRRLLENIGIVCDSHLVITDLGIDRDDNLQADRDNLELVIDAIQACCAEAKPIVRLGGCMCGI